MDLSPFFIDMFATNPYGGPSDDSSHLDGRVRNVTEFVRLLQTTPLVHAPSLTTLICSNLYQPCCSHWHASTVMHPDLRRQMLQLDNRALCSPSRSRPSPPRSDRKPSVLRLLQPLRISHHSPLTDRSLRQPTLLMSSCQFLMQAALSCTGQM